VPIDADDLPGFAIRRFDHQLERPEIARLVSWDHLERGGAGSEGDLVRAARDHKIKAIQGAQRSGRIASTLGPTALLDFILAISETGLDLGLGSRAAAAHRKRIAAAVGQLVGTA
jgi:Tetracyclin repressor-like, C-terminal domain